MKHDIYGEIIRKGYLDAISAHKDQTDVIKVLTGLRRCGKSTILRQYCDLLKDQGVKQERIVYINMESLSNIRFRESTILYEHLTSHKNDERTYIMLDEIQNIVGWEQLVASLMIDIDCDIYVTGSNAYLLSTELSTHLTGRSVQIRILPLSFKEFCEFDPPSSQAEKSERFRDFVYRGGMPFIRPNISDEAVFNRLDEIKSDVILKDICNRKKTIDSFGVRKTLDYMFSETGNSISAGTVSKTMGISQSTANEYRGMITKSLLFNEVKRYDLKGRSVLKTLGKYYCTDLGMRNTQPITRDRDYGRILENLVYLELVRRGNKVYVGKIGEYEIDFIAVKGRKVEYYQVAQSISEDNVAEREMRSFMKINGPGERYLITADPIAYMERDGVVIMNIIDWLSSDSP